MSAAPAEYVTACPPWCYDHYGTKSEGDLGAHHAPAANTPLGEFGAAAYFGHEGSDHERVVFYGDDNLTPQQARETAAALMRLADLLDEADR